MTHLGIEHRNIVELYANLGPGDTKNFEVIESDGKRRSSLVIRDGEVFIVTDVIVTVNVPERDPGGYAGSVDNEPSGDGVTTENRIRFQFHTDHQIMLHLPLHTGVVLSNTPRAFAFATNPGWMVVRVLGYTACSGVVLELNSPDTKLSKKRRRSRKST